MSQQPPSYFSDPEGSQSNWYQQRPSHPLSQPLLPQQYPQYTQYSQQQQSYGQPMPPMQPGMYPSPQPPKKKSRLGLWIVLGVVAVLLFGCIGVSAFISNTAKNIANTNTGSSVGTGVATTSSGNTPVLSTQHFAVGQVVKVGDIWNVTVNSVKKSAGDEFSKPKSGNTYLIVDLTMKNISSQEQEVSSLVSFNLQDTTGQRYTETITTLSNIHSPDGKVEAGALLRGQLVYEAPTSIHTYTLSFQADFLSAGQTIWDIQA